MFCLSSLTWRVIGIQLLNKEMYLSSWYEDNKNTPELILNNTANQYQQFFYS